MKDKIIALIHEISPYEDFDESTHLIESGILNSLALMTLISQLEDVFDIEITDDEIIAENFSNVNTIINLIKQ